MLSGSRDALRTEFGLYHYVVTDDEGHTKIVKNNVEADDWLVGGGPSDEPPIYTVPPSAYIAGMQTRDYGPRMSSSADVAVETRKFNCRLIGEEENIESDLHWKTLLLGGTLENKKEKKKPGYVSNEALFLKALRNMAQLLSYHNGKKEHWKSAESILNKITYHAYLLYFYLVIQ